MKKIKNSVLIVISLFTLFAFSGSIDIVSGLEDTGLEAPLKAGKAEADSTQAPKVMRKTLRSGAANTYPIYRIWSSSKNDHLFTNDLSERTMVLNWGWKNEGVAWNMYGTGTPVYRLYNPQTGEHFYTQNVGEKDFVINKGWFVAEGILGGSQGNIPVYRFYHFGANRHFFTKDENERKVLIQNGWSDEGIAFYSAEGILEDYSTYRLLGVPNYNQYALGAPSGCEGTALFQSFQYKGILNDWSLRKFLDTIPKGRTPYEGFVGSPYVEVSSVYSAIYPAPLTTWARGYRGTVYNVSGASTDDLINEVRQGNPSVVWVTINFQPTRWGRWPFGNAVNNNHAVTLDGYDLNKNLVHVSDSISGSYWLNKDTFSKIYDARRYSVIIR